MEEAVYGDCHLLITNFVENENPSFETFCTEWKKLGFQHIFAPQSTYIEIQQTTAAAFHIGKRLMCNRNATTESTDDFNEFDVINEDAQIRIRIGGLYLLYAIYFKQPLELYTKIEVSLETWREMKEFVQKTLPKNNTDYDEVRFIFWKLYASEAFRFTALDYCVGLENLVDYDNLDRTATNMALKGGGRIWGIGRLIEKLSSFVEVKQTTPALVALEDGYNKMKNSLTQTHKLDGQLLPPINIFQSIRDGFEKIEKILNKSDETQEIASGSRKPKSLKRSLKDKAFATSKKTNTTANKDANDNADDSGGGEEEERPKKFAKRMSSRTIFSEKLPQDVEEDLKLEKDNEESIINLNAELDQSETSEDADNLDETGEENPLNMDNVTKACKELLDEL